MAILGCAAVVAACGTRVETPPPSGAPFALTIESRSGLTGLQVRVSGSAAATALRCGERIRLVPGSGGQPPLPWTVEVSADGGTVIDRRMFEASSGPRWLVIFSDVVRIASSPPTDPAVSCGELASSPPTLPALGLSIDAAVTRATALFGAESAGPVEVTSASLGTGDALDVANMPEPDDWVWAITARGSFERTDAGCSAKAGSPAPTACPRAPTAMVFLDIGDGARIFEIAPAPSPP